MRSLRSSSTSSANKSNYWFDLDSTFTLPRSRPRKISAAKNNKENAVETNLQQIPSSVAENGTGLKSVILRRGGNKRKRDDLSEDHIHVPTVRCVVPSGTCKDVVISAEDWRPISAQMQSTVLDVIGRSTSMVEKNVSSTKDKKKLAEILTMVRRELASASAPPTVAESREFLDLVDYVDGSSVEQSRLQREERQGHHEETRNFSEDAAEVSKEASTNAITEWSVENKDSFVSYLIHLLHQERSSL